MQWRPQAKVLGLGPLVCVAVACGSTVQTSTAPAGSAGASGADLGQFAQPLTPLARPTDASTGATRPGAPGPIHTGPSGTSAARDPVIGGSRVTVGPGVAERTITIGLQWEDTSGGTAAVIGEDFSQGAIEDAARAVAAYVNRRGGLDGRRIDMVFHKSNYADAVRDIEGENERVCTDFTQDRKVFAALYTIDLTQTGARCLARRGVITFSDFGQFDSVFTKELGPLFYAPNTMTEDRGAVVMADALAPRGFFKGSRIGVVLSDAPSYTRSFQELKRSLRRHGLSVAESFVTSSTDTAKISSDMTSAVVRFRTRGVTHAVFLDVQGLAANFFMNAAESQQYRPWYALNTNNIPSVIIQLAPAGQLAKAQVLSWTPYDAIAGREQPPPTSPMRGLCLGILRDAGVVLGGNRTAEVAAVQACSWLLLMKRAFDDGADANAGSVQAKVEALRDRLTPAATYGGRFGPGRHDGASTTRLLTYGASCACWTYLAPGPSS